MGVEGFGEEYTLLAIEADPDFGLIYARADEDNQSAAGFFDFMTA